MYIRFVIGDIQYSAELRETWSCGGRLPARGGTQGVASKKMVEDCGGGGGGGWWWWLLLLLLLLATNIWVNLFM